MSAFCASALALNLSVRWRSLLDVDHCGSILRPRIYTCNIYQGFVIENHREISKKILKTAKLFRNGQSQAVRLPKEFRFEGSEVYIQHCGNAVVLLPVDAPWQTLFDSLEHFTDDFPEHIVTGNRMANTRDG